MARIPFITPNDVPANERPAFDSFIQKRGSMPGSGNVMLARIVPRMNRRIVMALPSPRF